MAQIYRTTEVYPDMRNLRKILSKVDNEKDIRLKTGDQTTRLQSEKDNVSYNPIFYLGYMSGRSLRIDIAFKQIYKYIVCADKLARGTYFHQYKFGGTKRSHNIYPDNELRLHECNIHSPFDELCSNSYTMQRYVYEDDNAYKYNCSQFVYSLYNLKLCGAYLFDMYIMHTDYLLRDYDYETARKAPLPLYTEYRIAFGDVRVYTKLMTKKQKRKSMRISRIPKMYIKSKDCLYIMGSDNYR